MKFQNIIEILTDKFPLELQEEFDNSGLQIGFRNKEIKKVLLTLDITKSVVDEAVYNKVDLIISHHPIMINPIKQFDFDEYYGSLIYKLIKEDIAVFSMHTNYDKANKGMNFQLLKALNASNIKKSSYNDFLFTGIFEEIKIETFIELVKKTFNRNNVRYSGPVDLSIKKVGIVGGSGGNYEILKAVINTEVDLFITGDTKSSWTRYARENGVNVLDISHNIEDIFVSHLYSILASLDLILYKSQIETDPYIYK